MRLREKGKKDGEPVHMGWDEAQAALQAGTHVVADEENDGDGKSEADKAAEASPAEKADSKAARGAR